MKKAFATNLRNVREQLGWDSARIAAKNIGIPAQRYRSYEEGRAEPDSVGLVQIAEAMGITNLLNFLKDPYFDYHQQDAIPRVRNESPIQANYRIAPERDRKLVDIILGITA